MKTRTKLFLFGFFCIFAAFAVLWQLFIPLQLTDAQYIVNEISAEEFAGYADSKTRAPDDQWNDSALRSDSPEDYREIVIYANVQNLTLLHTRSESFTASVSDEYSDRVLIVFGNVVPFKTRRMQSEQFMFRILMYTAGLDDAELDSLVKSLTIRLQNNRRVIGGKYTFPSFSNKFELDCAVRNAD